MSITKIFIDCTKKAVLMKKRVYYSLVLLILSFSILLTQSIVFAATEDTATLTANVQQYISLSISSGATVDFGNLTPGSPITAPNTGTIASVTTSSASGYTVGLSDASDTNSAMLHTDTTTYIADYAGTIATPTSWTGTGVGISLYAADSEKEAKWGTGTTYNDSNNKYAGIPSATTIAHTVTTYHAGADTSSWAFKIDVSNSQKTGSYSGDVTFTATAGL